MSQNQVSLPSRHARVLLAATLAAFFALLGTPAQAEACTLYQYKKVGDVWYLVPPVVGTDAVYRKAVTRTQYNVEQAYTERFVQPAVMATEYQVQLRNSHLEWNVSKNVPYRDWQYRPLAYHEYLWRVNEKNMHINYHSWGETSCTFNWNAPSDCGTHNAGWYDHVTVMLFKERWGQHNPALPGQYAERYPGIGPRAVYSSATHWSRNPPADAKKVTSTMRDDFQPAAWATKKPSGVEGKDYRILGTRTVLDGWTTSRWVKAEPTGVEGTDYKVLATRPYRQPWGAGSWVEHLPTGRADTDYLVTGTRPAYRPGVWSDVDAVAPNRLNPTTPTREVFDHWSETLHTIDINLLHTLGPNGRNHVYVGVQPRWDGNDWGSIGPGIAKNRFELVRPTIPTDPKSHSSWWIVTDKNPFGPEGVGVALPNYYVKPDGVEGVDYVIVQSQETNCQVVRPT